MKKLITAVLITSMAIAFNGCSIVKAETLFQGAFKAEAADTQEVDAVDKSLEIPQEAQEMFRSCAQLVSYLAVSTYDVDMQNLSAEDFWLIMSLVTYAEDPDSVGEFGTIDLKYEAVRDIAEAFFSEVLLSSDMPAPKGIYSASYVSAEQLYELQPVSVSDINPELVALEQTDNVGHRFLMKIKLLDKQERIKKKEWNVSIETWEDDAEHFFPYKFIKAWHVG
jgi:hypothetical protein